MQSNNRHNNKMINKQVQKLIETTAAAARKSFIPTEQDSKPIDINYGIPYVAVVSGSDSYFFQGEEAAQLLEDATNTGNKFNVTIEDAILFQAQSW